ncbi:TPA: hypothetical protein N0F65_012001, partial [Lagenidium giganteum]
MPRHSAICALPRTSPSPSSSFVLMSAASPEKRAQNGTDANKKIKLVGHQNFVRHNPMSDKFEVKKFHHVEFYTSDATNVYKRFSWGLGMKLIGKSDQSTNNQQSASYVVRSGEVTFVITAPYALETEKAADAVTPMPNFDAKLAHEFVQKHGLAVRALGIEVGDAKEAYEISVKNGAIGVSEPKVLTDELSGKKTVISEVKLYGDVVIRWISGDYEGPFIPGYEAVDGPDMSI